MVRPASPRHFTYDDDLSSFSSIISSTMSSPISSPVSSPTSAQLSHGAPRSKKQLPPRNRELSPITAEESIPRLSATKKRIGLTSSNSRSKPSSRTPPILSPSMRDTARRFKEHRDDPETPSRRYSPRKSVHRLSEKAASPSSQSCCTALPKEQPNAATSDDTSTIGEEEIIAEEEGFARSNARKKLFNSLREPDHSLQDLLTVLMDQNTSQLRRVNACGAIKTLTLNKKNQVLLARTRGVVSTLTSVLCRVDASEEERTRCINALMHLSVPEKNWHAVYLFPQTPEALARNMADRYPRIRYAACLAMSFLIKRNRVEVVDNRIVMYSIARVLEVDENGALERISISDRKVFVGSRLCALKMLLHLSKNKDVSMQLARTECIPAALVNIANKMELAANILCVATLTNLTRHPKNSEYLVYHVKGLLSTLLNHVTSGGTTGRSEDDAETNNDECAKCALYALQNLSCSNNCRQELANTPNLLAALTKATFKTQHRDQQLSALHTLKNLSDDPFNLVTITNTPGCTAALLALANDRNNIMAQYLACDTLATLSHWLLTLSTARTKNGKIVGEDDDNEVERRMFQTLTWEQWS